MIKNHLSKIAFLVSSLVSSNIFAHTGFHNEIYHPISGLDHFTTLLIIALSAAGTALYFYKK